MLPPGAVTVRRPAAPQPDVLIRAGTDLFQSGRHDQKAPAPPACSLFGRPENILPARGRRHDVPGLAGGALGDRREASASRTGLLTERRHALRIDATGRSGSAVQPDSPGPDRFTDAAAMDGIRALLTSKYRPHGEEAVDAVSEIVRRTGRSLAAPRVITASAETDAQGLPCVLVDADGTRVRVGQDPDTGGIRVSVRAGPGAGNPGLTVTLDGAEYRFACGRSWPASGHEETAVHDSQLPQEADHELP